MLPAISDFLKTTISESFQKALQPAGLVAAAVFVLLNLLFIFPTLVDRNVSFAVAYVALGTAWQAGVMVALTLLMAYLLLSLGNRILAILTGESWRDSPGLGFWMCKWQECKRDRLIERVKQAQSGTDAREATELRFELLTHFPRRPESRTEAIMPIMPTALGNVLNAVADDLNERYGIDLTAVWPRMEAAISGETALMSRINNERATLDFLVNLTFILLLFAGENLLLRALWSQWPQAVASILGLGLAGVVYMAAIGKARSWGDAVQVAFDLHRGKLRTVLGMREEKGRLPEARDWDAMSKWILFRDARDDLLVTWQMPTTSPTTVTMSANIKVTARDVESDSRIPATGPAQRVQRQKRVEYLLLLENPTSDQGTGVASNGAYVMMADSRISRIAQAPIAEPADWGIHAAPPAVIVQAVRSSQAQQVLWKIGTMPPRGAKVLRYTLPIYTFSATCSAGLVVSEVIVEVPAVGATRPMLGYTFTIENTSGGLVVNATLDISDSRVPASATISNLMLRRLGGGHAPSPTIPIWTDATCQWPIGNVDAGARYELSYQAERTSP